MHVPTISLLMTFFLYLLYTQVSTLLAFFMGSFINALLKKPSATAANKVLGSTSNDSHQETNSGTQRLE